jgi:PEP-CTERM motif
MACLSLPKSATTLSTASLGALSRNETAGRRNTREAEYYDPSHATVGIGDVTLTFDIAAVPEPGTYAMLLAGMALEGVAARSRKTGAH